MHSASIHFHMKSNCVLIALQASLGDFSEWYAGFVTTSISLSFVQEPVETTHAQCDDLNTCNSPSSYFEKGKRRTYCLTLKTNKQGIYLLNYFSTYEYWFSLVGSKASPEWSDESHSPGVSNAVASGSDQVLQKVMLDWNEEEWVTFPQHFLLTFFTFYIRLAF